MKLIKIALFLFVALTFMQSDAVAQKGKKSVEPLYWENPLNYIYAEVNAPKHMKMPKPILDDADGDGITDQFDNEPNTPAGSPVDSHGVSRDTDGLSLIHISEPTRLLSISYAVF